jgi:hypothetical protein
MASEVSRRAVQHVQVRLFIEMTELEQNVELKQFQMNNKIGTSRGSLLH